MPRAFVIRPFGKSKDSSGREIDFDHVHDQLIGPALQEAGLDGGTTGEIVDSGNIREDMFALILEADFVVCDITVHNANVFYELGIRHALRKKNTVMIKGNPTEDKTPFDLLTDRYLAYDLDDPAQTKSKLVETIEATRETERETDSPIFQMLPSLPEADPSNVQVVPLDFGEEVERAQAARSRGWLRLLSDEVRGLRFEWGGLKLVGKAQWDLKDYEGARESWEPVREAHPQDVDANLALANIYERLFKETKAPKLITLSDQAIRRVLDTGKISRRQRAEALALEGRNQKTRWALDFSELGSREERRKAATNRSAIRSYKAYQEAFRSDLNHFYPGLVALQMGTVLVDLSEDDAWRDTFNSDKEAEDYKGQVREEVEALRTLVPASVEAELSAMDPDSSNLMWGRISAADVLFLTSSARPQRVIEAYADAIPLENPFAWDAARGQLELFDRLDIQAELAKQIIAEIDKRFQGQGRRTKEPKAECQKPLHLIVFAGHRIDVDRPEPRFPPDKEHQAKTLMRGQLKPLLDGEHEVIGLASGAPGTDILAHELCDEVGVKSTVCLPMPAKDYASFAFRVLDGWRTRFQGIAETHKVLELSDRKGLPRWLHGSQKNEWERGNRWAKQMAMTWGAERISLIALWDGKPQGDDLGGTAHLVDLFRGAGTVDVRVIDSKELLG